MDRIGLALEIGNTNRGPVLCFALNKYVIYATGIYKLTDYDNKFNNVISVFANNEFRLCVSACAFGKYIAILYDNCRLSIFTETIDDFLEPVATVDPNRLPLGNLCAPYYGNKFAVISEDMVQIISCVDRTILLHLVTETRRVRMDHIISSSKEEDSSMMRAQLLMNQFGCWWPWQQTASNVG